MSEAVVWSTGSVWFLATLSASSAQMWMSWFFNEVWKLNRVVNSDVWGFFCFPCHRSDYFRNFVDSCLQKIPQDRPTSEELLKVGLLVLFVSHMILKRGHALGHLSVSPTLLGYSWRCSLCPLSRTPLSWGCCGVCRAGGPGFAAPWQCLRQFPRWLSKPALLSS